MLAAHQITRTRLAVIASAALAIASLAGPVTAKDAVIIGTTPKVGGAVPKVGGAVKVMPKPPMVKPVPKVVPAAPKINPDIIPKLKVVPPQADAATCQQYAGNATAIVTQAIQFNCPGLVGPKWVSDFNAHYNWCMTGITKNVLDRENQARMAALAACTSDTKK